MTACVTPAINSSTATVVTIAENSDSMRHGFIERREQTRDFFRKKPYVKPAVEEHPKSGIPYSRKYNIESSSRAYVLLNDPKSSAADYKLAGDLLAEAAEFYIKEETCASRSKDTSQTHKRAV